MYSCSEARNKSVVLNSHHVSSQAVVCPLDGLIYLLLASPFDTLFAWAAVWDSSSWPQELCSCLPSCPNSSVALLDTRKYTQEAVLALDASPLIKLARCGGSNAHRPPIRELTSTACSFLLCFWASNRYCQISHQTLQGHSDFSLLETYFFLAATVHMESNYFWKAFSYSMEY